MDLLLPSLRSRAVFHSSIGREGDLCECIDGSPRMAYWAMYLAIFSLITYSGVFLDCRTIQMMSMNHGFLG